MVDDASEFRDELTVLIAAARIPATTSPASPVGRLWTMNVGKISSDAMPPSSIPAAHRNTPTRRKRPNWVMTTTPDPTRAFLAAVTFAVVRMRWTIRWSVPWDAAERSAPPMTAAQKV